MKSVKYGSRWSAGANATNDSVGRIHAKPSTYDVHVPVGLVWHQSIASLYDTNEDYLRPAIGRLL